MLFEEQNAEVAELADAQASGACGSNTVRVQVPPSAFFFVSISFLFLLCKAMGGRENSLQIMIQKTGGPTGFYRNETKDSEHFRENKNGMF